MLDLAADHRVGPLLGGEDVLEFVEYDQAPRPVAIEEALGKRESIQHGLLGLRVERHLHPDRKVWRSPELQGRSQAAANAGKPGGDPALQLLVVGPLDADGDVGKVEDAEEVDVDRVPPFGPQVLDHPPRQ
jgi:hypothetical protein